MNLTGLDCQVGNDSPVALAHFQMGVGKREVAGLEIKDEDVRLGARSQSADLLFPVQDARRDGGRLQNYVLKAHPETKHLRHYLRQRDAERFRRRVPVEVGADRIRIKVLFERLAGGVPGEAATAVSHVENDSTPSSLKRLRKDRFGDHAVPTSMEAVSQDVAGA